MNSTLRRRASAALAIMAALLLIVPAAARAPDFDFPPEVVGFARGPRTDYEARAPGYGYSVVYTNGRWKADVYVYDGGVALIADGPSSSGVAEQIAQAGGEIRTLVERGVYRGSTDRGPMRLGGAAGDAVACRAFTIDRPDLGVTESLLCLTGLRGKYVKFRLSSPVGTQVSQVEAEQFIAGWLARQ
ncbi:hypothetical protein G3T14_07380 [Methylobacterium sp. BTF04]|uniref:hypothetical protein n=1 Tax=Methylobacterium sp. BTF04 TaxID=2708300 RepID=UPI0013D08A84|nr:hypothetical protein [Methylobacterium sp. BTF04]NEU11951.1 hypothetical protein [Methylobacterium sp. BTF04]